MRCLVLLFLAVLLAVPERPARGDAGDVLSAVVQVEARVPPDARSARTLGTERKGNGVLIGAEGLILTIGYLVMESSEVTVTGPGGVKLPATVAGYDYDTGFGLLRTAIPLAATPLELGDSAAVRPRDRALAAAYGGAAAAVPAIVVSKREFAGYWEYLLPEAIFTSPPIAEFGGAALIGQDGRLLGIGSLYVPDALGGGTGVPGNMFVPIDALKPILADLSRGRTAPGPRRPWLGLTSEELRGRLFISRVQPDSPAAKAGLESGDIVLGVGDQKVEGLADFYRKLWAAGPAGSVIELRVLQGSDLRSIRVETADRLRFLKLDRTY
ncbi:MAG: S1C family serine protease [Thalassobaculales bacterium]